MEEPNCCLPLFLVLGPRLVFHSSWLWSLQAWEPFVSTCGENSAAFLVAVASSRGPCLQHNRSMAGPVLQGRFQFINKSSMIATLPSTGAKGEPEPQKEIAALVVVVFLAA
jgi:hypothetical protein